MGIFKQILDQIKVDQKFVDEEVEGEENKDPNSQKKRKEFENTETRDKSVLKQSIYVLIANLCIDKTLRQKFAQNQGEILSQVAEDFKQDLKEAKFDYQDMMTRQLAIFVNVSVEPEGINYLVKAQITDSLEELIKTCKSSTKLEREILERSFNVLSKLMKDESVVNKFLQQRNTIFKGLLYYNKEFSGDLQMNALRTLAPAMKHPDFRKVCFEEHKFTMAIFDTFRKEGIYLFEESLKPEGKENWANFANATTSLVVYGNLFPELLKELKPVVLILIKIVKDKTDAIRKTAAVLLAKIATDQEMNEYIRANHGFEVLMSLQNQFLGK